MSEEYKKLMIPFSPPDITEAEIVEVIKTLESGWITTGPRTKLLERRLAAFIESGRTDIDCDNPENIDKYSNRLDIRLIYLSMSIIGILRPVFYVNYVKHNYNLNNAVPQNNDALKQKWNGMIHHFAYYIHCNTDIAILTIFINTSMVSVYNIYAAIVLGMKALLQPNGPLSITLILK